MDLGTGGCQGKGKIVPPRVPQTVLGICAYITSAAQWILVTLAHLTEVDSKGQGG